MDSITHTLMGLTIYGTVNKNEMPKELRKSLFTASVVGSHIPDIDILYRLTERGRLMYQMWHRGFSHSLLMAPFWALLIYFICMLIWKTKDKKIFIISFISVLTHIFFDALNTWGTGLFEPFSSERISLGIVSIVDFVIWFIILAGFIFTKVKKYPKFRVWRIAWVVILLHVSLQFIQGQIIINEVKESYDMYALSADFIPGNYIVIVKKGEVVELYQKNIWGKKEKIVTLYSKEDVDLELLFEKNPEAEVLYNWAPFVVVEEDDDKIAIYDPRFFRNGSSFLYEYWEK